MTKSEKMPPNFFRSIFTKMHSWLTPRIGLTLAAFFLLLLGFGIRMVDLTDPPFDFHPTRQFENAIVTRGIYYQMALNVDPVKHEEAIKFAKDQGTYEPPILEGIVALTYRVVGGEYLWIARIYTSLFWVIGGIALFLLVLRFSRPAGALTALAFYLFQSFGITASRSFQVDPVMVMAILWAAWGLYRWGETTRWRWALIAGLLCGLALLVKVTSAYALIGMALAVVLSRIGFIKAWRNLQVWLVVVLSGLPAMLFYVVRTGGGVGGYFDFWTLSFIKELLKPSFYGDWLKMVNSLVGLVIFFMALAGACLLRKEGRPLILGFWIGYGFYILSFPFQITTHEYYHLQMVPLLAISLAPWGEMVAQRLKDIGDKFWRLAFVAVLLIGCGYPLWLSARVMQTYNYTGEALGWAKIGQELPRDGSIIGLVHAYGFPLIYYGWREVASWPTTSDMAMTEIRGGNSSSDFALTFHQRTDGFRYFLITLTGELDAQPQLKAYLQDHYQQVPQGGGVILYDLASSK